MLATGYLSLVVTLHFDMKEIRHPKNLESNRYFSIKVSSRQ